MTRARIVFALAFLLATSGCRSMNSPSEAADSMPADPEASDKAPEAPILLGMGYGVPEDDLGPDAQEEAQSWSDLTRAARESRQQGDFESARDKLEKASMLLSSRAPADAARQTVFGARARLAMDFVALKRDDDADELADQLFDEAEAGPEIGGPPFSELAYLMATRRRAEADESGTPDDQLRLLRLALIASESGTASIQRLQLAYEVSQIATAEGQTDLARSAIDRAVLDAQTVAPLDQGQLGSLKIFKARIALAQGDLVTAEASATSANRIFEEMDAPEANRAVAEATLARVLAQRGQIEKARAIGAGAEARLSGDASIEDHAVRVVRSELARLEVAAGDTIAARAQYEMALAIPAVDFEADRVLIATMTEELAALEVRETESPSDPPIGESSEEAAQ